MCGRFGLFGDNRESLAQLGAVCEPPLMDNYNIAPGREIAVLRRWPETGVLEYGMLRWGLLPFWSKTETTKFPLINARAETIDEKPSFRGPFRHRRCIIPARGYYEWQKRERGKQPWFIRPVDTTVFLFAGIWDLWQGENGLEIESCAIITTNASQNLSAIHDRMPVILEQGRALDWLDPKAEKPDLLSMLNPNETDMEAIPVSSYVNNARNNGPECIKSVG